MASEKRDNSGTLGVNRRKEKETHPSHNGSALIDGVEYWIDAWVKESNGSRFFSLSFKRKDSTASRTAPNAPPIATRRNEPPTSLPHSADDDIPF